MDKSRDVKEWLRRAKSNLVKSKLPKTEEEYKQAVDIAERVYNWVLENI